MSSSDGCISHKAEGGDEDFETAYAAVRNRFLQIQPQDPPYYAEVLDLLEQLAQFELGRFLIAHRGLNGFWTSYVTQRGHSPIAARHGAQPSGSALEDWLLNHIFAATQERFTHFQRIIQRKLHDNMTLASIPCGVMDELLSLDYTNLKDIRLIGVDIDNASLQLAQENAALHGLEDRATFVRENAWALTASGAYDLVSSNGLNIYEPDAQRRTALYRGFCDALAPGGTLVASFLTPPYGSAKPSPWRDLDPPDLKKAKMIFADILDVKWQVFETEDEFRSCLEKAGFTVDEIIYDQGHRFPTVVARKGN